MNKLSRDLRATLREFLTLDYGLTYDQCVEISEKFTDFMIRNTDDMIELNHSSGRYVEYWDRITTWGNEEIAK